MADDFLSKLRMANIFPASGGPREGVPFGMPDLNAGNMAGGPNLGKIIDMVMSAREGAKEADRNAQIRRENFLRPIQMEQATNQQSRLAEIAGTPGGQQKNVVFKEDITPYQRETLNLQRDRLRQTGELGQERIATTRAGQGIAQQRADVYQFKAQNPNMRIMAPRGGNLMAINPMTGEAMDLGIPTGTLSDEDRLALTGEQRMEQIGARGDIQRELTDTRGQQRLGEIAARANEQRLTNIARPETPGQVKTQQQINLNQLIATRPDLSRYVTIDPNTNSFTINENAPANEKQMITNAIYGKAKDVQLPSETTTTKKTTTPKASDSLGIRGLLP